MFLGCSVFDFCKFLLTIFTVLHFDDVHFSTFFNGAQDLADTKFESGAQAAAKSSIELPRAARGRGLPEVRGRRGRGQRGLRGPRQPVDGHDPGEEGHARANPCLKLGSVKCSVKKCLLDII